MSTENIFITGATGCIGHYVVERLRNEKPDAVLHLMARRPERFKMDVPNWDNVHIYPYAMDEVDQLKDVLKTVDYVIHIATVWGYDLDVNVRINRDRMLEMFGYTDPNKLKRIIYFSTASILTSGNVLSDAAKEDGIPYVKSKYIGYQAMKASEWADKVITLFPTMVLGGSETHPYSHISEGLLTINKPLKWARWFSVKGTFHFLHAQDIATMVLHCLDGRDVPSDIVMGNPELTFNQVIHTVCDYFKCVPLFRIPISRFLILFIINVFRLKVDPWARHCIRFPFFNYQVHSPADFGYRVVFSDFQDVLAAMFESHQGDDT